MIKRLPMVLCMCLLFTCTVQAAQREDTEEFRAKYQLQKLLVLSRHNIRSPLGKTIDKLTPHQWFVWTSAPGELSQKGGELEAIMGQYFRERLVHDGLITENEQPKEGEVRFYANSMQRTIATAQYFSSGMLPVANVRIEHTLAPGQMDPVFTAAFTFMNDAYQAEVMQQIAAKGGTDGLKGIGAGLAASYGLLENTLDSSQSEAARSNGFTGFRTDDVEIVLENHNGPYVLNSLQTAISASDAMVLQYYEEEDPVKAAFGHKLTAKEWKQISQPKDTGMEVLCGTHAAAVNLAHPLLQVMQQELSLDSRKFTFLCGHDTNLTSVIGALDIEPYTLQNSIEAKTPIGAKLVLAKWLGPDGQEYASLRLIYQSTEQLRNRTMLSLAVPPVIQTLSFQGLQKNADGLYAFQDVVQRFQDVLAEYDQRKALSAD